MEVDFEFEDDFESRYADELEVIHEMEGHDHSEDEYLETLHIAKAHPPVSSQHDHNEIDNVVSSSDNLQILETVIPDARQSYSETVQTDKTVTSDAKRNYSSIVEDELCVESFSKRTRSDFEPASSFTLKETESHRTPTVELPASYQGRRKFLNRIPQGEFVTMMLSDGNRVYLRLKPEERMNSDISSKWKTTKTLCLLSVPLGMIREQLESEEYERLVSEERVLTAETDDVSDYADEENDVISLWTDKFKPSGFIELLSDDAVNRHLLHWLKLWDKLVFGREFKSKKYQTSSLLHKRQDLQQNQQQFKSKKGFHVVNEELDIQDRPQQKVILLCGPPGLGKTTLAHVIARHAGYYVVEMNASDDRSPEAFRSQIEAATKMRAVLGEEPRPNCLVIDEIDGAPAVSINLLVSMIMAKGRSGQQSKGKKNPNELSLLRRPIICICNDQYVPALKPLRQIALVINVPPTLPSRLAFRLLEITQKQRILSDLTTLLALCEKASNDIRSCLSTLQFVHSKNKMLKKSDVLSLNIGMKDEQKNLFAVWNDIFYIRKVKRSVDAIQLPSSNESHSDERFNNILRTLQGFGDYDKILSGVFENYLLVKFKDHNFELVAESGSWFTFFDIMTTEISHSQVYQLMAYLPYVPVQFHYMYASTSFQKLVFPASQYEFSTKLTQTQNIVGTMVNEMTSSVRAFSTNKTLVLDKLPLMLSILQPDLRPVNTQLYTSKEKEELNRLIGIMITYNLTYHQLLMPDGQFSYQLDPDISEVVQFLGLKSKFQLSYAIKQLIAHEIEMQKLCRNEKPDARQLEGKTEVNKTNNTRLPSRKHIMDSNTLKSETKPPIDFFGRFIKKKPNQLEKVPDDIGKGNIWFHFKEGYSNAVRRYVKVQDLL